MTKRIDQQINRNSLFLGSCIALVATSMTFAIRANLIGELGTMFSIPGKEMGIVIGTAFWGFTLAMIIGGPLCDILGMRRLVTIAFAGHFTGIILTITASGFWSLFISTLMIGIANGFVEAACNPLVSSLYPDQKTKKLNQFHVWFPGGIVIGGLAGYFLSKAGFNWQVQVASILVPTTLYGFLLLRQKFPVTERISEGISTREMFTECMRPLFLVMVLCMLITAATELGTNQWIVELLNSSKAHPVLLLVFISGLMAIGRYYAGIVEHRLSPPGILFFSAILSTCGLILLSYSTGYWTFLSAAVFAAGICYFWPTMLGFVSEYMPKTGALGLAIMGGAGMLSVSLILPYFGDFFDAQTALFIPDIYSPEDLKIAPKGSPEFVLYETAKLKAGSSTLRYVAILPAFLITAFALLYWYMKKLAVKSVAAVSTHII